VGLERGLLSLVSTTEELLGRKCSGSGLESREYGRRDPLCLPRNILNPQKLALTSSSSGGPSVGIVPSQNQATVFFLVVISPAMSEFNARESVYRSWNCPPRHTYVTYVPIKECRSNRCGIRLCPISLWNVSYSNITLRSSRYHVLHVERRHLPPPPLLDPVLSSTRTTSTVLFPSHSNPARHVSPS
jgi:hypothetical protein